jgi:hypothetical protein
VYNAKGTSACFSSGAARLPRGSGAYRHIFPSGIATLYQKLQTLGSQYSYDITGSLMNLNRSASVSVRA